MKKIIFQKLCIKYGKQLSLIFLLMIPISFATWGQCIWGIGTWGSDDCNPKPQPIPSDGSRGSVNVPPTFTQINLFGSEPIIINGNYTCEKGYQLLDGRCYSCDEERGYLKFNPDDRSVMCVECGNGFIHNGTSCIIKDNVKRSVNKLFAFGLLFLSLIVILLVYGYHYIFEKDKKKPSEDESQEEEKD